MFINKKTPAHIAAAAVALTGLAATPNAAALGITLDVITPGEYALPVDFKPFNVFVQYATLGTTRKDFDAGGNRVDANGDQTIVGLSKYVRFWTFDGLPKVGFAYEVILPEVGLRNPETRTRAGGIGDPLTGFAVWFKPTSNATFGLQNFLSVPVGNAAVGGGDAWADLASFLWTVKFGPGNAGDYTADAGAVFTGKAASTGRTPGTILHTNQRIGYNVTSWLQPFIGADYQYQAGRNGAPSNHALDADVGLSFFTFKNQSIAVKYSFGVEGKNFPVTNTLEVKYVYSWP
ncbi:MAG: transporter [Nevskia sp.]|jgi:hypothetical protein|nr:transporter [Nevskia sp.]